MPYAFCACCDLQHEGCSTEENVFKAEKLSFFGLKLLFSYLFEYLLLQAYHLLYAFTPEYTRNVETVNDV